MYCGVLGCVVGCAGAQCTEAKALAAGGPCLSAALDGPLLHIIPSLPPTSCLY